MIQYSASESSLVHLLWIEPLGDRYQDFTPHACKWKHRAQIHSETGRERNEDRNISIGFYFYIITIIILQFNI